MDRCPNHRCRHKFEAQHSFCQHCGIALKVCTACRRIGKLIVNRADGFFCRHCGGVLPTPKRGYETNVEFEAKKNNFLRPVLRLSLGERSDSFALSCSQAWLWILTSNNGLKIVDNSATRLQLYNSADKFKIEPIQSAINYLKPLSPPIIFRDRLVLLGGGKIISFSIHPQEQRWLQDIQEIPLPEGWQPIFNSEAFVTPNGIEVPLILPDSPGSMLLRISYAMLKREEPLTEKGRPSTSSALLIGAIDPAGLYYWGKNLTTGQGQLFYLQRSLNQLIPIDTMPLLFPVRPVMIGERVYAITEDFRLIEFALQQALIIQQRKLNSLEPGVRALIVASDKIVVAVHQQLNFFDYQTGALLAVAQDIDVSHMFTDSRGMLLVILRNGQLLMINSAQPLERWSSQDATLDDSRVFDAFIINNSLYTLSENGEVCRFDFN